MRIALMPSAYFPMVGGVEELSHKLATHLVEGGVEAEIWTPLPEGVPAETEFGGIRVRRLPMTLPPAKVGAVARFPIAGGASLLELMREVHRFRPDVIHVQCFSVNGAYATALSWLTRVPLVVTLQGETVMDDNDIFEHSVTLRTALRLGIRRAAAVTGCSRFVLDDAVTRFGLHKGRGVVIPNGVDLGEHAARSLELPFQRFIACLGRLVPKKGFDLMIDAFPALASRFPDLGLVIAGSGACRERLLTQSRLLGLEHRVHLPGSLDRSEVSWLLDNAQAFVLPSRLEPFGIVTLEAWRSGCPVVATNIGGTVEVIHHGVDGLLVDVFDSAALGEALLRLLEDGSLRSRLVSAGLKRVQEFDWARITSRYRDVYTDAVRSRRHGADA